MTQPPWPAGPPAANKKQITCPKCGSATVTVDAVTETKVKHRGCLAWGLWILAALCTFGLIIIIPALTNTKTKSKRVTEAVCQTCGHRWIV
jgi:DNA-directed RNA polymerase subunit RPC12/RpoP